jgi:hypothetical protein
MTSKRKLLLIYFVVFACIAVPGVLFLIIRATAHPVSPNAVFFLVPAKVDELTRRVVRGDTDAARQLYLHYAFALNDSEKARPFGEISRAIKPKD